MKIVISVSRGDKGHKVSINGIQNGVEYSTPQHANKEAKELKEKRYPSATLYLMKIS